MNNRHSSINASWLRFLWLTGVAVLVSISFASELSVLKILRENDSDINRDISDSVCIGFEQIYSPAECQKKTVDRLDAESTLNADFIIVEEEQFNRLFSQNYRLVLPIYRESFTVVAKESDREDFKLSNNDVVGVLDNNRQIKVAEKFLDILGMDRSAYQLNAYKESELLEQFCRYNIKAVFLTSIHPNHFVRKLNTMCDGKIISLVEALPDDFFQRHRYLYRMFIPKENYWRLSNDVETFSHRYFLAVNNQFDQDKFEIIFKNFVYEIKEKRIAFPAFIDAILTFENPQTRLDPLGEEYIQQIKVTYEKPLQN